MIRIVHTRPATADDIADIAAVYMNAWRAGYAGLLDPQRLEAEAINRAGYDWLGALARSDSIVLVAEFDDVIVGVIECEHDPPRGRAAEVHLLYVSPGAWGTGAASALLGAAAAQARRAGQRAMWLDVVEPQARARRFYEREGWQLDDSSPPTSNGLFRLLRHRRDV
jgi:GNAT superfamily N-acetyltransferase